MRRARVQAATALGAFALVLAIGTRTVASAQSFVNPSFEDPVVAPGASPCYAPSCPTGWVGNTNGPGFGYSNLVHSDGAGPTPCGLQFVILDSSSGNPGHAVVSQMVTGFMAHKQYKLHFAISSEFPPGPQGPSQISVALSGAVSIAPVTFTAGGGTLWSTWVTETLAFTPPMDGSVTFTFTHVGTSTVGSGVGLDCIDLPAQGDHEVCYLIQRPDFTPPPVFYTDQFGTRLPVVFAKNKRYLCTPATKCVPAATCIDTKGNSASCGNGTINPECCEECETTADCGIGTCQNCACVP